MIFRRPIKFLGGWFLSQVESGSGPVTYDRVVRDNPHPHALLINATGDAIVVPASLGTQLINNENLQIYDQNGNKVVMGAGAAGVPRYLENSTGGTLINNTSDDILRG